MRMPYVRQKPILKNPCLLYEFVNWKWAIDDRFRDQESGAHHSNVDEKAQRRFMEVFKDSIMQSRDICPVGYDPFPIFPDEPPDALWRIEDLEGPWQAVAPMLALLIKEEDGFPPYDCTLEYLDAALHRYFDWLCHKPGATEPTAEELPHPLHVHRVLSLLRHLVDPHYVDSLDPSELPEEVDKTIGSYIHMLDCGVFSPNNIADLKGQVVYDY